MPSLIVIHNICEVSSCPSSSFIEWESAFSIIYNNMIHIQQSLVLGMGPLVSFCILMRLRGKCIITFFSAITSLKDHLLLKWYTDSLTTKRDHRNYIHTYYIFLSWFDYCVVDIFPQLHYYCQHYLRHTEAQNTFPLFYSISCNHFCCWSIDMVLQYLLNFEEKRNYYISTYCGNLHNIYFNLFLRSFFYFLFGFNNKYLLLYLVALFIGVYIGCKQNAFLGKI